MTKSPQSATKRLPLASLFRWLAVLCFIKLSIFTMILLDFPFPALFETKTQLEETETKNQPKTPVESRATLTSSEQTSSEATKTSQKADAEKAQSLESPYVPAFLPEETESPMAEKAPAKEPETLFSQPNLPLPAPLPAPIAEPGTLPPKETHAASAVPVPSLGSVTAAHAAASMPVPQAGPSNSPFAPVEQNAPLTRPGVPDIPAKPQERSLPTPSLAPNARPQAQIPVPGKSQNGLATNTEVQELARQQQDILMLKKQMDERLKELQDSEAKVKRMLDQAKGVEDEKLRKLIQMYANMKPKTAAKALESMDERTACQILQYMTPKQSGDILSYTNPAVTAKLTELLTRMRTQ
ncbi:MAG: hypothetical protein K6G15_08315 [Desulfovibrio sp.]|nr:hypothetical protein [Desulfovibrio sp.]